MTVALWVFVGSIFLSCPSTIISSIYMIMFDRPFREAHLNAKKIYSLLCVFIDQLQPKPQRALSQNHWIPQRRAARSHGYHAHGSIPSLFESTQEDAVVDER